MYLDEADPSSFANALHIKVSHLDTDLCFAFTDVDDRCLVTIFHMSEFLMLLQDSGPRLRLAIGPK